jgi:hypothetical protein
MKVVKLREIAFTRSGDKGNISNVGVIPYDEKDYDLLLKQLTVEKVKEVYDGLVEGPVVRYEFPGIKGINFVMYNALQGGVSRSLNFDVHGKNRSRLILDLDIELAEGI